MARAAVLAALVVAAIAVPALGDSAPPSPWDGVNPFACELQNAGFGTAVPHPEADPYCVEFDKRRQNVTELGVVDFISREPARVAAASDKCFYFQSDHWRGSIVQDDGSTKTYEWDGHYFFDKARAEGGVWVTNFNVNGKTGDPSSLPGMPAEYAKYFGPGTGGVITHDQVQGDPACVAKAAARSPYALPTVTAARCADPAGGVGANHVGAVALGMTERRVRELLGTPARLHRGFMRYCLRGGGKQLVGVVGDRSGETRTVSDDPVRFLLTTRAEMKARGVGRGDRGSAVRRAFPAARRLFVQGRTEVSRLKPGLLVGVRFGRVRFLAAYDPRHLRDSHALREWLRRSQ